MDRIFTDPRFPGIEVRNDGTPKFHVFQNVDGVWHEIDTFETHATVIDDQMAQRRAATYFQRMVDGQMNAELADRRDAGQQELPGGSNRDHSDIFGTTREAPTPTRQVSLDDLMGGNVMTSEHVMAAYDQAQTLTDPAAKKKAMERVSQMASRLESAAEELVRRLID